LRPAVETAFHPEASPGGPGREQLKQLQFLRDPGLLMHISHGLWLGLERQQRKQMIEA